MASDDLNRPLGLDPKRAIPWRRVAIMGGASVGAIAAGALVWVGLSSRPGPVATAVIDTPHAGSAIVPERTGAIVPSPSESGLTDVTPTGELTDVGGGEVVIHDPSAPGAVQLASIPRTDLLEPSDTGELPRIGDDGTRPLEAYARPSDATPGRLRVAIVVGGLGIDPDGTSQAINSLPGPVTLAFAPYGETLKQSTAAALAAGHEILLQVPLEPFNYPKNNPGPNTLTADASEDENRQRLHWFLGRMTNYIGVVNYMGARFTGEPDALRPVIKEIGGRGLLYIDDGSSARSEAADVASGIAPFLRADVVLDADLTTKAIDERLTQLIAIARERGYAVASGTAFPMTIDRIAEFARTAASRGVILVPVSALVAGRT